jgi:predicted acyl esterase
MCERSASQPFVAVAVVTSLTGTCAVARGEVQTFMVAMRDGTKLSTDVYAPEGEGPWPVALMRTPYPKSGQWASDTGKAANEKGYVLVVQDVRGRGDSEGNNWIIFGNDGWGEHKDGFDTVAWIGKQSWCNGKIGTWGGSALGITQNMLAPTHPPHLVCQHVAAAFSDFYAHCAYPGGAWRKSLLETWLAANKITEHNQDAFLAHPRYDAFWEELNALPLAEKVNTPAVYVGGWYDCFCQGIVDTFMAVQARGGPKARGKCRLIMGPWAHGIFKELEYPDASYGKAADPWPWLDYRLKGEKNGLEDAPAVEYYVMGDPEDKDAPGCEWRAADSWPPPSAATPYYLHADGRLDKRKPEEGEASRSYDYDPRNPVGTIGGGNLVIPVGPMDQRKVEKRPDVLVFTSDVLPAPLEVTGRIKAKLWVSSSAKDTDFTAKLCDVYPDGRSMLVADGILRARYRKSFREEHLLKPRQVYEIEVDLWSTSLIFNKGHRIRVAVSSSNYPRFDTNPNTGGPVNAAQEPVVATNTIHLDASRPSHIVLPVCTLTDAEKTRLKPVTMGTGKQRRE